MIKIFSVESVYQPGKQEIHVLLPDEDEPPRSQRVLYVLPVERGFEQQYGYGLGVIEKMDAHNRYGLICVQPGFALEPWYGDHISQPHVRQASYLRDFIVPWVERRFSVSPDPANRLLLGFSKSGWGAFSLILSNPAVFSAAAAWDAPLMLDELRFQMPAVFGTRDNLERYRPDMLAPLQKHHFQSSKRLVLAGECSWGEHTAAFHELLTRESIQHLYLNHLHTSHRWDASWVESVIKGLIHL